jgi:hypothetical protein
LAQALNLPHKPFKGDIKMKSYAILLMTSCLILSQSAFAGGDEPFLTTADREVLEAIAKIAHRMSQEGKKRGTAVAAGTQPANDGENSKKKFKPRIDEKDERYSDGSPVGGNPYFWSDGSPTAGNPHYWSDGSPKAENPYYWSDGSVRGNNPCYWSDGSRRGGMSERDCP